MQDLHQLAANEVHTWSDGARGKARWFEYATALTAAAAATSFAVPSRSTALIEIDADSYFFAREITGVVLIGATNLNQNLATTPQPLIEIFATGSGAKILDRATAWSAVIGVAERPMPMTPPLMLNPTDTIEVVFTNRVATALNWQVCFAGTRLMVR